ncbi:uncharacterized protein LOC143142159 [Alosa pseudoharengus]|uniref:uncharacterized protein LOC143142159 n=1 Tax=Alosa pseudoharengus TaxID=34774 RepID=UPI003F8BB983
MTQPNVQTTLKSRLTGTNSREYSKENIHMSLDDLKQEHKNDYTRKEVIQPNEEATNWGQVPHYPRPVEFCVSTVAHVTTERGLEGIMAANGFKGGERGFLWWGLVIGQEEIAAAEQRYLETLIPEWSPEEIERQKEEPFLHNFTTSPAFKDESRYGNFRFTFNLDDLLQKYSTEICGGQTPVLKVYKTSIYKQEVMYTVLIHSPDVCVYKDYPELDDNDQAVCLYRDGKIIWRAQAISETHHYKLTENKEKKEVHAEGNLNIGYVHYVWDHVTLAFHMPRDTILPFSRAELEEVLTPCDKDNPSVPKHDKLTKDKAMVEIQKYAPERKTSDTGS